MQLRGRFWPRFRKIYGLIIALSEATMPAGRPRKPIELKQLHEKGDGKSLSHSTPNQEITEYVPVSTELVIPEGLGERGTLEWNKTWIAGQAWLHKGEDYHWIEMLCRAYDEMEIYTAEIKKTGLIVKGYAGQKTANPLIKEKRECERVIMKCLSQIGFSPTDRARLGLAEIKAKRGLADLQQQVHDKK
jgi:P27 family predicted phage terminase small subunit